MTNGLETWENVTPGTVWILGSDHRGAERPIKVKGGAKAQIKLEDREAIELSKPGKNPFENGRLRRIDPGAEPGQRSVATSDDELREVATTEDTHFLAEWLKTESELNLRRLSALVKQEKVGSYAASEAIGEALKQRFPHMTYTDEIAQTLLEQR